ncbi:MAG TPA: beta-propeller fold lactonase family protein [Casimicrobiaceae bacterium]|nr:beta-propeller fold lactonase family protein [Casimicrobiaceae bacterium]
MRKTKVTNRSNSAALTLLATVALAASCVSFSQATRGAETGVAYVSTASGLAVIDLGRLEVAGTIDLSSAVRGLAVTPDGKYVLAADEASGDVAVIDSSNFSVVRRVPIGKNPEFMRMQPDGAKAYVTFEPSSSGKLPGKGEKDDDSGAPAEVAAIDLHTWTARSFLTGGRETEGIEFSPDGKRLSVANEGDDTVTSYDKQTGKLVQTVDLHSVGSRPRGIKVSPDGTRYVVTMENSDTLVVLDPALRVEKTVPVEKGPYGVAFDRSGQRLFVAAARAKTLQVFDARTFQKLADIPVGDRCWHFSFTPGEAYLLVACGRSNDLRVVDAKAYRPVKTITGLKLAWGVVTYPKANGSLDAR